MMPQVAGTESGAPAAHSPQSPASAPSVMSPAPFTTNTQVDNHHQIYYAVVDDKTEDVVFEFPPEALREIGESLNLPLAGDAGMPSLDVKS
jgi:hypothetical protein